MRLLLIAGHGAGDPGATALVNGRRYREAEETRRLAAALRRALPGAAVYPTERDAFQDFRRGTLGAAARFEKYDFVLELHFNAFEAAEADGRTKGVECYVPTAARDTEIAGRLCRGIAERGFTDRGVRRKDWSVIRAAHEAGTAAALLEVCFLDDADDMAVYEREFPRIVRAVVRALGGEEAEETVYETLADVPAWGRPTVEKLLKKGWLRGEDGKLALEHSLLRGLVVNDRAGLYGA